MRQHETASAIIAQHPILPSLVYPTTRRFLRQRVLHREYKIRVSYGHERKNSEDRRRMARKLDDNQDHVTRKQGTEPPFTGEYENEEAEGTYTCVCCGQPLFFPTRNFILAQAGPAITSPWRPITWN